MGLRLILFYFLVPAGIGLILGRPFWGTVFLSLFYFVRPGIWGGPDWFKPVLIWSVAMGVSMAFRIWKVRFPLSFILCLVMLGTMVLSSFGAVVSSDDSFSHNLTILKLLLAMLFILNYTKKISEMNTLLWSFSFGVLWMNKSAIYYYLKSSGMERVAATGGQGGESNFLATCITMTLPFLLLKLLGGAKWERLASLIAIPIWLMILILTGTRSGLLALLVIAIIFFLRTSHKFAYALLGTVMFVAFITAAPERYWMRMETILHPTEESSSATRLDLWKAGMKMFEDHPLTGIGQDNFVLLSPVYARDLVSQSARKRQGESGGYVAHNTFLQLLVEGGIQSVFFFILILGVSFKYLWNAKSALTNRPELEMLREHATSIELGLVAFIVNACFESYIHIDVLYFYLGCAAAIHLIGKEHQTESKGSLEEVKQGEHVYAN